VAAVDPQVVAKVGGLLKDRNTTGWNTPTLLNSWANKGAGFATCAYRRLPGNLVMLRGTIDTGTPGNVAFTLPPGFRPSSSGNLEFGVAANGGYGQVTVGAATGNVRPDTMTGTWISLDGIVFLGEQ
jgi:hypothetical protein